MQHCVCRDDSDEQRHRDLYGEVPDYACHVDIAACVECVDDDDDDEGGGAADEADYGGWDVVPDLAQGEGRDGVFGYEEECDVH